MSSEPPLILHVLPRDLHRGAQVFARALRDQLDGEDQRHRTLTIYGSPVGALDPDHSLALREGLGRRLGFDPRVSRRLRRQLASLGPSVVVAHGGEPLKYCARGLPPGCQLIYYKIGSSQASAHRPLRARWHRWLLHRADAVVAISEDLAAEAVGELGVPAQQVTVIPNGRDPDLYRMADHDTDAVQLIFIGRLEEAKRPAWFVECVRQLAQRHPGLSAVMVGDGPLLDQVRQDAAGLPIKVMGRRDDVPDLLAASQVLVSPSEREGMPGVLIEAGFAGLPVVTTEVAGARAVVRDGVTGHIVPGDDVAAVTERTEQLVTDPATRAKMGAAARHHCCQHYSLVVVARAWAETIDQLSPLAPTA